MLVGLDLLWTRGGTVSCYDSCLIHRFGRFGLTLPTISYTQATYYINPLISCVWCVYVGIDIEAREAAVKYYDYSDLRTVLKNDNVESVGSIAEVR